MEAVKEEEEEEVISIKSEEERHGHIIKCDSYFMVAIGAPRLVSPDGCNPQAK